MVDVKNFLSPKFIFPVVGVCVLVVVAALVAVFYVRNPTVTDNLFANQESTGAPDDDFKATTGMPSAYTGTNGTGSYSIDQKLSAQVSSHDSKTHETHATSSLMSTLLSTTTHSSASPASTEPRAIEPVKHE